MKTPPVAVVAVVAAAALAGCESSPRHGSVARPASPAPTHGALAERPSTRPQPVRVENRALGASRGALRTAIGDLKALGLWDDLTRHLYVLQISSRPGRENIPENEHLADALLSAYVDEQTAGVLCSVMFFPAAVERDLARQRRLNARALQGPPPTRRAFYVALLAHELAHCLLGHEDRRGAPRQAPERVARGWENRVLAAAQRS